MSGSDLSKRKLRRWVIGFAIGFCIIPGFAIGGNIISHFTANTISLETDAAAAEPESRQLLDKARQAVQGSISPSGDVPKALKEGEVSNCGLSESDIHGDHYVLINAVQVTRDGQLQLVAVPLAGDYPVVRMRFFPQDSGGEIIVEPSLWE